MPEGKKRGEGRGKHRHPIRDDAVLFFFVLLLLFCLAERACVCMCVGEYSNEFNDFGGKKKYVKVHGVVIIVFVVVVIVVVLLLLSLLLFVI